MLKSVFGLNNEGKSGLLITCLLRPSVTFFLDLFLMLVLCFISIRLSILCHVWFCGFPWNAMPKFNFACRKAAFVKKQRRVAIDSLPEFLPGDQTISSKIPNWYSNSCQVLDWDGSTDKMDGVSGMRPKNWGWDRSGSPWKEHIFRGEVLICSGLSGTERATRRQ